MPADDTLLQEQFLSYKKVSETANTVKFTSVNEHIIDCHLFALYGIWMCFESNLSMPETGIKIIRNEELTQSYIETNSTKPANFWDDEDKDHSSTMFYGPNITDTISRSSFGSFSRSSFGGSKW